MIEKLKALFQKYREVITYLFFGVIATLTNIIVSFVCKTGFHWDTVVSNVVANAVAMTVAYITNKLWVFESKTKGVKAFLFEIISFYACRIATAVFDVLFMWLLIDVTGWGVAAWANSLFGFEVEWFYLLIKVISNIIVIILNYVASKIWIFRKKKPQEEQQEWE